MKIWYIWEIAIEKLGSEQKMTQYTYIKLRDGKYIEIQSESNVILGKTSKLSGDIFTLFDIEQFE